MALKMLRVKTCFTCEHKLYLNTFNTTFSFCPNGLEFSSFSSLLDNLFETMERRFDQIEKRHVFNKKKINITSWQSLTATISFRIPLF